MDAHGISAFLKERRHELGLSLKGAAKATGIQPSRLHDLEQGKSSTTGKPTTPTRDNIKKLALGYKVSEDFLLDLMGRPTLEPTTLTERLLLAHFRELRQGHQEAVLGLVDALHRLDIPPHPSAAS